MTTECSFLLHYVLLSYWISCVHLCQSLAEGYCDLETLFVAAAIVDVPHSVTRLW